MADPFTYGEGPSEEFPEGRVVSITREAAIAQMKAIASRVGYSYRDDISALIDFYCGYWVRDNQWDNDAKERVGCL